MEHMTTAPKCYRQTILIVCTVAGKSNSKYHAHSVNIVHDCKHLRYSTKRSSDVQIAYLGLAWYSIDGSLRLFLQIAQVSAQISQLHIATAFHFLISNRGADCWPMQYMSSMKRSVQETCEKKQPSRLYLMHSGTYCRAGAMLMIAPVLKDEPSLSFERNRDAINQTPHTALPYVKIG
eukprot:2766-Heterococcus_DN1.PRE.2